MESQFRSASRRQDDEHITNLLLFGFLQNVSGHSFHEELDALHLELFTPQLEYQCLALQTDGNRSSQQPGDQETDSENQDEIIQDIARQLALIGDDMDHEIRPALVQNLVARFTNRNLSQEERRKCLEDTLGKILQSLPKDVEQEKTALIVTMLLAKNVIQHVPSLLRDVFHTTANFIINRNLLGFVRNLVRNDTE